MVANHISYWDPVLIGCALPRQVFFMGKKEVFAIPGLGFLLKSCGTFPVDRGRPDRGAIKRGLALLRQGQAVGIFPEGKRNKTGSLLPPNAGAAYFTMKAGVPVCPIATIDVKGASSWGLWRRRALKIGPCIKFDGNQEQDLGSVADQIMFKIQELLDSYDT